nr:hypothetical protein [Porticoccus sp.]
MIRQLVFVLQVMVQCAPAQGQQYIIDGGTINCTLDGANILKGKIHTTEYPVRTNVISIETGFRPNNRFLRLHILSQGFREQFFAKCR